MDDDRASRSVVPSDPAFYKTLLDELSDGVYFVDRERRIQYWNEGAHRLTGYRAHELIGRCCQDDILCHIDNAGRRLCLEGCPLSATIADGSYHEANVYLRHKEGRRMPVTVHTKPLYDAQGEIVGAIEIFSDNSSQTENRRKIDEMKRMAFLDHVTQVPNRRFMKMSLDTAISEFQVHQEPFAVLIFDLDRFKQINDRFGHNLGDYVLLEVAKTLSASLRPTDILGRWGGDEFLALVRNVNHEIVQKLAERCVLLVAETRFYDAGGAAFALSVSLGVTLYRQGESLDETIERADQLMYRSKADGRGRASIG